MNLVRRDPFENPFPAMSRLFNQFLQEPGDGGVLAQLEEGTLPLDISEDEKNVIVRASVPGFSTEDIEVEVHDGILTIKAQHNEEHEEKGERFYRRERRIGSMMRRVALPSTVREDGVQAELRDGVLTLSIPKSEAAMPRKVQIRDGSGKGGQSGQSRQGQAGQGAQGGQSQRGQRTEAQGAATQDAGQSTQNTPKF